MTRRTVAKASALAIAAAAATTATPLAADNLNFAYGYPTNSAVGLAVDDYAAALEERSGGDLKVKSFAMSLLSLPETSPGVRDGLADVGFVLPPYYAAEYSTNLFLHELNQLINLAETPNGKEPLAYTGAMLEYTMQDCPECVAEFAAQNQVYTGGGVTPLYNLLCKDVVVTSVEDLKGKRLRAGGAGFVRFAEHFGAQGVRLPVNEVYEALDQGILDCAMLSAPELTNYNLHEVVTDITIGVPGGAFAGVASANVNRDRWTSMSDEQRSAMLYAGTVMTAATTWNFYTDDAAAIRHANEKGITIHDAEPGAGCRREGLHPPGPADRFDAVHRTVQRRARGRDRCRIPARLEKWYALVAEIETQEQLTQLLWDEVVSKVDPAAYAQ